MRKMRLFVLVLSGILLMGCLGGNGTPDGPVSYAAMRDELEKIPGEYPAEEAAADGHVVIVHGTMASDPALLQAFIEETGKGMRKDLTLVQYTVEGDPILTRVNYDGAVYRGMEDNTRDRFGEPGYRKFQFRYLKVLENQGRRMVILVDDETVTFEKYMRGMQSSHMGDAIPNYLLCSYQD